ncbi:MAG: hypothetical protein ACTTKH_07600 [Treponema sp.]
MLQIYLLVVAVNALMGAIIIMDKFNSKEESSQEVKYPFLHSNTFTLALTIFACIIATSSLIAPYEGIIILGDLFPSLITFAGYFVFLTRYIKQNYPDKIENNNFFSIIEANEYYIGIACLAISIIHFLFPTLLFL